MSYFLGKNMRVLFTKKKRKYYLIPFNPLIHQITSLRNFKKLGNLKKIQYPFFIKKYGSWKIISNLGLLVWSQIGSYFLK